MEILVGVLPPEEHLLPNETAVFELTIPELQVRQYLYLPYDEFHRFYNTPEGVEDDLLVLAGVVYLVDQLVLRSSFPDNWTRDLSISIPVKDPKTWEQVSELLADALQFLTGDTWQFEFYGRQIPIYHYGGQPLKIESSYAASAACLFSGGLDSLAGAIDLLESQAEAITLVSHYDLGSPARKVQVTLANRLEQAYPSRINKIQARIGGVSHIDGNHGIYGQVQNPPEKESTLRSRSILFFALGLYVARQHSSRASVPLLAPENGFVSLNPPLTDARVGSCSTRTTHPVFLEKFQTVVNQLGIPNTIHNPLADKSKGEVLARSLNKSLMKELASQSVSCAHPTRRRGWLRRDVMHCGYCVPCLVRRASLHKIGLDSGSTYGFDVWAGELGLSEHIADDLRAILNWVYNIQYGDDDIRRVVRRMNLPNHYQTTAESVIESGFDEMKQIISDKAEPHIKQWAGLEEL